MVTGVYVYSTDSDMSTLHSGWHSLVEMMQLCFVSTSLGDQVLILSEFITFNNNSKPYK